MSDINAILDRHGIKRCGDSSCIFGPRGGMMTNGGCRCGHDDPGAPSRPTRLSRQLAHAVTEQAAEIARLTAELAAAREAAQRDRDVAQSMAKAAHDAEEQLAAARAVPADVEAAIGDLKIAAADFGIAQDGVATGCAFATEHRGEASARMRSATDALRTAIARAISEAEQRAVGDFLDRAKTLSTGAGTGKSPVEAAILDYRNAVADWEHDDPISGSGKDAERRQCDAYIALLAAISDATAARGTVGGLLATRCCSKCRGISSHTPGGIPCDECGLVGSMPWGG